MKNINYTRERGEQNARDQDKAPSHSSAEPAGPGTRHRGQSDDGAQTAGEPSDRPPCACMGGAEARQPPRAVGQHREPGQGRSPQAEQRVAQVKAGSKEAAMLKRIGLTVLVTAVAVMTGCARGPVSPTETPTYAAKPVSVPAGIISSEVTVLWRAIGIYRATGPLRLAGPMYEMTSYETKAECEAAQQEAVAKEALSRMGPTTERLSNGIRTWDSDRQHYTTFRYLCLVAGAGPAPFR